MKYVLLFTLISSWVIIDAQTTNPKYSRKNATEKKIDIEKTGKKIDIEKLKDPLRKIDLIQIGLTGANTQVFDRKNIITDPPSREEFEKWNYACTVALSMIREYIPDLDPLCEQFEKLNQKLKKFCEIVIAEKDNFDTDALERYTMLMNAQWNSFKIVDNTFNAFASTYRKKLARLQKALGEDFDLEVILFGTEEKEKKISIKRQTLLLAQVILETFRAVISKILKKDIPNASKSFELDLNELIK